MDLGQARIAVIGLGYVGLPLAVAFGRERPTLGFDVQTGRIEKLKCGIDDTREVEPDELRAATHLAFADDPAAPSDPSPTEAMAHRLRTQDGT